MSGSSSEYLVTLSDGTVIVSDGCTGFPDQLLGHDFTQCCAEHDGGGSNGRLLDCLTTAAPGYGWAVLLTLCVLVMIVFRPVNDLLTRIGIIKLRKASK